MLKVMLHAQCTLSNAKHSVNTTGTSPLAPFPTLGQSSSRRQNGKVGDARLQPEVVGKPKARGRGRGESFLHCGVEMSTEEKHARGGLVSEDERKRFVEAVLSGKLAPDVTQIAYHFAGRLDSDVVDAVVEASAGPSDAVLALAGMSLARDTGDIVPASNLGVIASPAVDTTSSGGKKQGAGTSAPAEAPPTGDAFGASKRHAMTLGAMQAQFASGGERLPGAKPQKEAAAGGSGVRAGGNNAELEKVSAFISSYAGEQDAAAKASGAADEPPKPPFFVPRGTVVPSTRKTQLVITNTAEKTVEVPGFEAFMKMQHGKDTLFRFLAVEHPLHSYYLLAKKHVQEAVMKGGKAKGACASVPRKPPPAPTAEDPAVLEITRMLGGIGT